MADVKRASKAALATLGQVTWAANNCKLSVVNENGEYVSKTCRDSTDPPKRTSYSPKNAKTAAVPASGEQFSSNEVEKLLKKFNAGEGKKPKARRAKKETGTAAAAEAAQESRAVDHGRIAKYADLFSTTAQGTESDTRYVSFSSFLAIEESASAASSCEPAVASSSSVFPASSLSSSENKTGPLDQVVVYGESTRARPVKLTAANVLPRRDLSSSILSLVEGKRST